MNLRFIICALAATLLLTSCKEVSFTAAQPVGISAMANVPEILRGRYLAKDKESDEKGDTLIIESWGYHFKEFNDKDWLGRGVLSDSLVLKSYHDYFFVNFRTGGQWVVRLIRPNALGDIEFLSIELEGEEKSKETIRNLSKKVTVTEVRKADDTFYQINPTVPQLMSLIDEGFFSGTILRKVK